MDMLEFFMQNNNLKDTDDIEALIDFASLVRELIDNSRYADVNTIINYTIEHSYYDAFSWSMGILQEELVKAECGLKNTECVLGKSIPNYDEFIKRLQVDFDSATNGIENVYDTNGEVESFFNIFVYRTGYENIRLVSLENFDTKDNDYIQYKLSFV